MGTRCCGRRIHMHGPICRIVESGAAAAEQAQGCGLRRRRPRPAKGREGVPAPIQGQAVSAGRSAAPAAPRSVRLFGTSSHHPPRPPPPPGQESTLHVPEDFNVLGVNFVSRFPFSPSSLPRGFTPNFLPSFHLPLIPFGLTVLLHVQPPSRMLAAW
ncbi:hypothetical protein BDY21DRAFT_39253 [Lineolata rhizophorae]|uniref:Uncharacterized protein n=1 Tax=Lineolata rhizophorae TaxID=578093 RepID=A0A6A6P007_9PEZI|nr:hypothetical protein BDY21DRAFT_39253 [Lineolata rhizophorae]